MITWEYGPGDLVTYIGCSDDQLSYGGGSDPRKLGLVIGEQYRVYSVTLAASWSTLELSGFGDDHQFNTVYFELHSVRY